MISFDFLVLTKIAFMSLSHIISEILSLLVSRFIDIVKKNELPITGCDNII